MVLPDGFAIPAVPYTLLLLAGTAAVGALVLRADPPVTSRTVLALTPWMGLGGGLHVVQVLGIVPAWAVPLLGTPAVYISTAILAGIVWLGALERPDHSDAILGIAGAVGLGSVTVVVIIDGVLREVLSPFWPLVAVVLALLSAGALWVGLATLSREVALVGSWSGLAVLFGHALDGISTAIGVDVLAAGERSPLPRAIIEIAARLPTAELIGVGWLFVLVKLVVAGAIVWLFVPFAREAPRQGHLLLALLAAVGLGPGVHNLLLFMVSG